MKYTLSHAEVWIRALASSLIAAVLVFGGVYLGSRITTTAHVTQSIHREVKLRETELQKIDRLLQFVAEVQAGKGDPVAQRFNRWLTQSLIDLCDVTHAACPPLPKP